MGLGAALLLALTGCGEPDTGLVDEVRAAWQETYATSKEWNVTGFTADNGSQNVTVVTSLQDTPQGREAALGVCRAVASLGTAQVTREWRSVYVTAGQGGRFLAECKPVR